MSLLSLLITLVVFGFLLWAVNKFIPMDPTVKTIINVVVCIVLVIFVLKALGLLAGIAAIRV